MNKTFCVGSLILALMVGSGAATAGEWLTGVSVGTAKQFDYEVGGPVDNRDDTDSGYRVFGGFMFTPNLGVIGSWVDLGEMNYDGTAFGGFTDSLSADGFDISFVAGWAPGSQQRANLFGTVGFFNWDQNVHYTDLSGDYRYNDSGTSVSFGIGTEISFGEAAKWGFHIAMQRFLDVGDPNNSGHEYDRDLYSLGVDYRFGR